MSIYYTKGYKPPKGITSASQVKAYQRSLGVKSDGIWGEKTQKAYESRASGASSKLYAPPLGISKPDQIKTMQGVLDVKQDGIWGEKTQAAYERWHEYNDLKVPSTASDGFIDRSGLDDYALTRSTKNSTQKGNDYSAPDYTPPLGIYRKDQIKTMQEILGVKADGIWGEKTQKAYEEWSKELEERQVRAMGAWRVASSSITSDTHIDSSGKISGEDGLWDKAKKVAGKAKQYTTAKIDGIEWDDEDLTGRKAILKIASLGIKAGISAKNIAKAVVEMEAAAVAGVSDPMALAAIAVSAVYKFGSAVYGTAESTANFVSALEGYRKNGGFHYSGYSFSHDDKEADDFWDNFFYLSESISPMENR